MKNAFLCSLFSISFFTLSAQITFTASDLPGIGDKIVLANDTTTQNINPGPSGPNQTWDFSQLTAEDTLSLDIIDPAGTENAALFPEATFAIRQSDATVYAQLTNDALLYLGLALDTFPEIGIPVSYRNVPPQIVYKLPTTSTTSFTQEYGFSITADGSLLDPDIEFDSVRLVQEFNDNVTTDGYGTLITPEGTFQALRLRTTSTSTFTISGKAFGIWIDLPFGSTTTTETYTWIAKETGGTALSITYDEDGSVSDIEWWLNPATAVAPNAEFTYVDLGDGQVKFNDLSANNPTSWMWDFGDGTTSTQQEPTHTYATEGTYTVCLTASNENGSDQDCQQVFVVISSAPVAQFTFEDQGQGAFTFTDASTNDPTSWMWDFGDGSTSMDQNPTHTFAASGTYTVCLTATNSAGSDQACQDITMTVVVAPTAAFTFEDQGQGAFTFTDASTNAPTSWMWDFGDGATSMDQNPTHTFAASGTYSVCLTAANTAGSDQACQDITTTVVVAPTAAFTFEDQGQGAFTFTDASTNAPTSWMWDFGDGATSMDQNPTHTFAASGTYSVCLTATNIAGSDQACQDITTTVVVAPTAAFTFEDQGQGAFSFTDASTNAPTSWMWDFGDGSTSMDQNPTHTFAASGTYTVCLTAANIAGEDQACQAVMTVVVVAPVADFTPEDLGNGQVKFTDASINDATSWMWDFGDGTTSDEQSPTHTYAANGTYNVCLTVTNIAGTNQICKEITVVVTSTYALERDYGFRLYPNPASTGIQLELKLTGQRPLLIRFQNALGQQVFSGPLNGDQYIDVQSWPAGTYIFSVRSQKGELLGSGKVMIE